VQHIRSYTVTCLAAFALAAACDRPGDQEQVGGGLGAGTTQDRVEGRAWEEGEQPVQRSIGATASAQFIDTQGREVGSATLEEGPNGVLVRGEITGLTPGPHGFHFHEVGRCEPPFESAGGHFAPHGRGHGLLYDGGPHGGDMPNIVADGTGRAAFEVTAPLVTLGSGAGSLLDADGTSIVVHAGPDDHRSQPSGNSGDRVACAVVTG
jgi:superoxide dismutase, Cu-Zn family